MLKAPSSFMSNQLSVLLIGAGGNGSEVLDTLNQFHFAMLALGHDGIHVDVYDGGEVREPNLVRQRFFPCDLGQNKAISLVNRYNMMTGTSWEAFPLDFDPESQDKAYDLVISAVDLPSVRWRLSKARNRGLWLDLGNGQRFGQAVLGSFKDGRFPNVVKHFPAIEKMEDDTAKSCSTAESLAVQDALTNRAVATAGMNIVWQLLRYGQTNINIVYIDMETGQQTTELFD